LFEAGQTLTGTGVRLGMNAEGVLRPGGKVLFVPGLLPGEEAEVRVDTVQKRFAFGSIVHLVSESEDRVSPPCAYYGECGGCSCQHMRYEAQLEFKQGQVDDCLRRVGGLDAGVENAVGMDNPWRYRNKTRYQVGASGDVPVVGFFARGSRRLIPVDDCLISHPEASVAAGVFRNWMSRNCNGDDVRLFSGLTVQVSSRNDVSVTVECERGGFPRESELVEGLSAALPSLCHVGITLPGGDCEDQENPAFRSLFGAGPFQESLGGLEMTLSPGSFLQVNHEICGKLYHYVLEQATLGIGDTVADLYCGAGALSLMAARRCARVAGVELSGQAVRDARRNAEANGIQNASFHRGFAEEAFPRMVAEGFSPDTVLLDPPRKGAHPALLRGIADARPETVIYVSCHPPSQARDAAALCGMGYRVAAARPFDMFCQTAEVENVLTFKSTQEAGHA